jgi:hypothetical protein
MDLNNQTRLKISFEERFRREVRILFNRIKVEYRIGISTGSRTRANKYKSQWEALLMAHYRRVQNGFRGIVQNNIKQVEPDTEDLILAALIAWAEQNAPESAARITNTTQDNMDDSLIQARQAFSNEGNVSYTDRELSLVSAAIIGRKFTGRENAIIVSETQKTAESTKLIEAFGLSGLPPSAVVTQERVPDTNSLKEWLTVGDEKVRVSHKQANGQKVKIDRPYIVNDQQLMYPGDNSRGATVENTINCRCSAFYIFKGV